MELVVFNCKRCGAELDKQVDSLGTYPCKYCGFENKLDDTYEVNYISTDSEQDLKTLITKNRKKARHLLYDMKLYDSAYKVFLELYEYLPNDKFVLEGLMISLTKDFKKRLYEEDVIKLDEYLDNYRKVQDDINVINDIDNRYKYYKKILFWNKFSQIFGIIFITAVFIITLLYTLALS